MKIHKTWGAALAICLLILPALSSCVSLYGGYVAANYEIPPYEPGSAQDASLIRPGMYVWKNVKGGAEIIHEEGNKYRLHVDMGEGLDSSVFNETCWQNGDSLVCPAEGWESLETGKSVPSFALVRQIDAERVAISAPKSLLIANCGPQLCFASEEGMVYIRRNEANP